MMFSVVVVLKTDCTLCQTNRWATTKTSNRSDFDLGLHAPTRRCQSFVKKNNFVDAFGVAFKIELLNILEKYQVKFLALEKFFVFLFTKIFRAPLLRVRRVCV